MKRILIVDDHAILRQGLKQILADELAGAHFGEAGDASQALTLLHQRPWDVLILDVNIPGRNGFEVLDEVKRHFPFLPVLILSSTPEDQLGLRAIKGGAAGYLNKQTAPEQLVEAVETVASGGRFITPALAARLAAEYSHGGGRPRHELLSDRELQVFKLTATGKSAKEIAHELALSAKTISTFRTRLFEKLGVKNDVELVHYAQQNRLMPEN
jgi:DNA-binding NarL/FixJ family response regulator